MLRKEAVDRLLSQQTAIARKVYQAVPIEESWTHVEIYREFVRIHGTAVELRVVGGCVSSLIASGLVRQIQRDRYRREPVRETQPAKVKISHANRHVNPPVEKEELEAIAVQTTEAPIEATIEQPKKTITMTTKTSAATTKPATTNIKVAKKDPLERLLNLSEQLAALTETARGVIDTARDISEQIGELTLELTEDRAQVEREKQQVEQLRTLLGTFMAPATTQ